MTFSQPGAPTMNAPDLRLNPHLEASLTRIRLAAEQAAERCAEGLGLSALSAAQVKRRDALLAAQFLFRQQQPLFSQRFVQSLRKLVAGEQAGPTPAKAAQKTDWGELSLMDDDQVNNLVAADRIGLAIGHHCEWELREVESYVSGVQVGERNPLRPELIGQALLDGVQAVTDDSVTRQTLTDELTRALAQEMRACYADIAELLRSRGLRPQDLRVRSAEGGPLSRQGGLGNSQHGDFDSSPAPLSTRGGGYGSGPGGFGGGHGGGGYGGSGSGGAGVGGLGGARGGPTSGYGAYGGRGGGGLGMVEPQMMDLLRRLAQTPAGFDGGGTPSSRGGLEPSPFDTGAFNVADMGWGHAPMPPNLIHQHRDELRQMATGRLDHMVIDVVGSLFDQILSDPKVPPQMARLLARLQLPVLRVALGDETFFSSRRHPVRVFVNRMASLACAFDDFVEDPGKAFLAQVRELVQDVATGDFDRMDVYTAKLDALEVFIAEQTRAALKAGDAAGTDIAALVERKEVDLRLQQGYAQQLQQSLAKVPLHGFLRDFLAQVWSQAIVHATRQGPQEQALRLRTLGRSLVLSVQPKGGTAARAEFLRELPNLMRTLNEGLDLIAWPEPARKDFFGALLPAHAESLKGQTPTPLETNLLIKQLDQIFGVPPPSESDLAKMPVLTEAVPLDVDLGQRLTAAEAKSLGLVDEAGVNWDGKLDLDLTGNDAPAQALEAVDISIDGLPAAESAPEPTSGAELFDHLQLGCAYQMHTGDEWHKVRLAHVSAGRSFFIFTQGSKHQKTVTMTARMMRKLCEAGRLRAFENAYLIERATARARKQLAALGAKA
jgi:hypothetical protein